MSDHHLIDRAINTIRLLSADAVQQANSGHPGLPMGAASMAYVLWTRHLRFDPSQPAWPARDRFVLSAGHGSMLLYSLLHLTGFDLSLDEIKRFRQWESKTPGHPEYGLTPGVETTTGPLGQGFANGVGIAIAAERLAALFNREGFPIFDHFVYGIVSDGDLMEGVGSEAASLAGHLRLGRLIYLYDDNHITIDGSTDLAFTEDREARFRAYGWHVVHVDDGNDLESVHQALVEAKADPRPSLIACRTHIGFGLPTRQDTASAHGEPPGEEELAGAKDRFGWPQEPRFLVPQDVRLHFEQTGQKGRQGRVSWEEMLVRYRREHRDLADTLDRILAGNLPQGLEAHLPTFPSDAKGLATRAASGKTIAALALELPELTGGSADLTTSNQTQIKGEAPFSATNRAGRYIHFGVREHAMGSALSGIALHGGLIPYGGTFLIFSDYMRRAIPGLAVIRPADANETVAAWLVALERAKGPVALALTRQAVPTLDREAFAPARHLRQGAYILADLGPGDPELILMASGSEVHLVLAAGKRLAQDGRSVRVVSFPSWELFAEQPDAYQRRVLPPQVTARVAIEAGVPMGWERWVGDRGAIIGLRRFGASAPYQTLYERLGLTEERILEQAQALLAERVV